MTGGEGAGGTPPPAAAKGDTMKKATADEQSDKTAAASSSSTVGMDFGMPAGRYDGLVSLANETIPNLTAPFADLQKLKSGFWAKGLTTDDMVTVSGAHSVVRSHCSSFSDRLPPNASDMDLELVGALQRQCNGSGDPTAMQDLKTPNVLDSQYYRNVLSRDMLFMSDAALRSTETLSYVVLNVMFPPLWEDKFKAAMVKMGGVDIKTSAYGEIRKNCRAINKPYTG